VIQPVPVMVGTTAGCAKHALPTRRPVKMVPTMLVHEVLTDGELTWRAALPSPRMFRCRTGAVEHARPGRRTVPVECAARDGDGISAGRAG
jgi:hypothetical protein